jgi:transporter family-2 protein
VVILVQGRARRTARILATDARWWWYAVGLCGVPIVVMFAIGIPVVGVAIASVCSVAGQTVAGLALDARGVGVPAPLRLTGRRLAAAMVAVAGLVVAVGSAPSASLGKIVGLGALMFVSGAVLTGQQAGNGRVNLVTGDPVLPVLTSSGGGTVGASALVGVVWASGHLGAVQWPGPGHWWLYLGGPLGAAITVCAAWAIRHLGTFALTLGVVVGQMATAVLVDLVTSGPTRWPTLLAVVLVTLATLLVVVQRRAGAAVPR